MILEVALLSVKPGQTAEFEQDFKLAGQYISQAAGYISHTLKKCLEDDHKYILLAEWETLESHTIGFRQSAAYLDWKKILHHYYDPFPVVEHFEELPGINLSS